MWRNLVLGTALALTAAVPACGGSGSSATVPGTREFGLSDTEIADHIERTQGLIASCMQRAGFEYVPVDVASVEKAQGYVRAEPGLTERQYRQKWGYAVTTRFDDPRFSIGLGPNFQTMQNLPPAQRAAYKMTLLGANQDVDFAVAFDDEDFSDTGGCTREAVSQVFTPDQLTGNYQAPKDVALDRDPRMRDAKDRWAGCLRDQGYNFKDDDDIISDLKKRLGAIVVGDQDPSELTGDGLDRLHALQAQEVKVSLVELDCKEKFLDPTERQIETEMFGHPLK